MRTITLELTDEQIDLIRQELDRLPFKWAPTAITKILSALPFTESAASPSADSAPSAPSPHQETEGRFFLRAHTAYGQLALNALLARLPRTGDL